LTQLLGWIGVHPVGAVWHWHPGLGWRPLAGGPSHTTARALMPTGVAVHGPDVFWVDSGTRVSRIAIRASRVLTPPPCSHRLPPRRIPC